ncbi:MAG: helix-turn-helix domain-containing protein, partial [Caulobacteraceae bacterium]|nr:helix-turn-helix domain-containing protein [Caulobacteraceae bacterium]
MPLEKGTVGHTSGVAPLGATLASLRPVKVVLPDDGDVGAALRGARETLGLEVEDIALVTRVRAADLAAIEAFDLGALPSRPFAVGYVRAYARALGLDAEAVVARFKAEAPPPDGDLRAPAGLGYYTPRRWRWLAILALVVVAAVVAWNLSRRARIAPPRPHATLAVPRLGRPVGA